MSRVDVKPRAMLASDFRQRNQVIETASRSRSRRSNEDELAEPSPPCQSEGPITLLQLSTELRAEWNLEHCVSPQSKNRRRSCDRVVRLSTDNDRNACSPVFRGTGFQRIARDEQGSKVRECTARNQRPFRRFRIWWVGTGLEVYLLCPSPLAEPVEQISRNGLPRLHSQE